MKDRSETSAAARGRAAAAATLAAMTREEDAAITAAAEADPDARPMTDAEHAAAPRGRPPLDRPKQIINIRLDADVVDRLKADGPGWQTRANGLLRQALDLA